MKILEEYNIVTRNMDIQYKYYYRLLRGIYNGLQTYGVQIKREDYNGEDKINEEEDSIERVSTQIQPVKEIVLNLYKNQVSPIHLIDILGEFVDEHVYEFDVNMITNV